MDSVQMGIAPIVAGIEFDAVLRDQLLDRRDRLHKARTHVGHNDFTRLLSEVDAALLRFENGSYGVCIDCSDAVEPERLMKDPLMTVCIGCLTDKQRATLEDDLQLAADIQRGLLPRSGLACETWTVDFAYHPAGIVSGDYVDIIEKGDEFYFVLGDVSGKGMAASLLMSNLHAIFHSLAPTDISLGDLMQKANRLLNESSLANQFATLIAGRANRQGDIEISNAGHLPPVLISGGEHQEIDHAGLPLGMFRDGEFAVSKLKLNNGDALLLFSDGVTETLDPSGVEYGSQRLREALSLASAEPGLIAKCITHLNNFRNGADQHDDVSMLSLSLN